VRLDLGAVRIPAQLLRDDEPAAELDPVDIRAGAVVRVVVTDRAIPFGQDLDRLQAALRALQARADIRHLLAEGGGTGALAVGARQHRQLGMCSCQHLQKSYQRTGLRQQHIVPCRLQQPRIAEIIEVLGGAAEVHQLERCAAGAGRRQLIAHEVLDRLDVVIDALLDRLDDGWGAGGWIARQRGAPVMHGGGQISAEQPQLRSRKLAEPQGLDPNALTDQRGLGKVIAQRRGDGGIATIHGRERCQGGWFHQHAARLRNDRLPIITH
jgi:glutathione S-transferase